MKGGQACFLSRVTHGGKQDLESGNPYRETRDDCASDSREIIYKGNVLGSLYACEKESNFALAAQLNILRYGLGLNRISQRNM